MFSIIEVTMDTGIIALYARLFSIKYLNFSGLKYSMIGNADTTIKKYGIANCRLTNIIVAQSMDMNFSNMSLWFNSLSSCFV